MSAGVTTGADSRPGSRPDGGPGGRLGGGRAWRIWRIVPLYQTIAYRGRFFLAPFMMGVQVYLYYLLWTAVYQGKESVAGLDVHQAVTYAALAILVGRIRWSNRMVTKDNLPQRTREGTVIYWFLRPISPGRYYMYRAVGDMGYGAMWALIGYLIALATGVIRPPASVTVGLVFVVSLVLGQMILYYLGQLVDLATFWLTSNSGLTRMYSFVQDLLSGVFVPLWFLPGWLLTTASVLPFAATVNVPISIYVGRIPLADAPENLLREVCWVVALALLTKFVWSRAARRVTSQGG
ncbi:ABC-2 family transporter protein [Streptomyces sp. NBC_01317]|uniref:ABC transporter permease n=1 Tax=Streptomyces sp. NBC_01317 TaxID=2903822 RepID=UPI002E1637F8|nr:ABC-2 family transporter protein [Streptomyces sp. NBC_01317]